MKLGFLFVELASSQRIRREKLSTAPWMKLPNGASLSHPSTCHKKFRPGVPYRLLLSLRRLRHSTPSSLKSEVWSPSSAFVDLLLIVAAKCQRVQNCPRLYQQQNYWESLHERDKIKGCVENENPITKTEDLRPCGLKRKPTSLKPLFHPGHQGKRERL